MSVYDTLHGLEIKNDGEADNITVKDHSLNIQGLFIFSIAKHIFQGRQIYYMVYINNFLPSNEK